MRFQPLYASDSMNRRDYSILFAFLFWILWGPCRLALVVDRSDRVQVVISLMGMVVSGLYIGLDLLLAPHTSLHYRLSRRMNGTATPGTTRFLGLLWIVGSLLFGWMVLRELLGYASSI